MIDINLLPEELRPRPRSPLPYLATLALVVVVVLYCVISSFVELHKISGFKQRVDELDEQIEVVRASAEAVKELESKERRLNAKRLAIGTIMADRIVWSKVLYMLARIVPEDVWLTGIVEKVKTERVTIDNPDPGAGPKKIQKTVTRRILEITGYALSPREEQGVHLVGRFVRAMEDDQDFSERFRGPEPQSVNDAEFEDVPVKDFQIWCRIAKGGSSE